MGWGGDGSFECLLSAGSGQRAAGLGISVISTEPMKHSERSARTKTTFSERQMLLKATRASTVEQKQILNGLSIYVNM